MHTYTHTQRSVLIYLLSKNRYHLKHLFLLECKFLGFINKSTYFTIWGKGRARKSLCDEVISECVSKILLPNFVSLCAIKVGNLVLANHTFSAFFEF